MSLKASRKFRLLFAASLLLLFPNLARADGIPQPWQIGFQNAASPVMEDIAFFHNALLILISLIVILVLGLLAFCFVRFNHRANPNPSKTSHNTKLEVIWTLVPALILLVIAAYSYPNLQKQLKQPEAQLTIKAVGHQWFWTYEYPDHDLSFDSIMIEEDELKEDQLRLLSVDNPLIVPVNANVRVIVTASDVLHAFAMPAFGVKIDAVPGRLNETWFRATQTGTFYGQCSELCGTRHAFMPIEIRVVSQTQFSRWLRRAKRQFSSLQIKTEPAS